jgi:accessory colonization factor AcfC
MKFLTLIVVFFVSIFSFAEEPKQTFKIFGTEGPYPAMKEAADAFAAANNLKIEVVGNAVEKWKVDALKDSDIIYSSSENIMDTYNDTLGIIDAKTITALYMRPAAILVRPGNPKKIKGIKDLIHRDLKVIIVNGQGQIAMWEDIVGRLKDVEAMQEFRKHIAFSANTISEALHYWKNHDEVEAWLAFNTWDKDETVVADVVNIEKDLVVYRTTGAAVTSITNQRETALKFIDYLKTAEAEKIFKARGWFKKEK